MKHMAETSSNLSRTTMDIKKTLLSICIIIGLALSLFFFAISTVKPLMGVVLTLDDQGWRISSVDPKGQAALAGIKIGDIPVSINGQEAQTFLEKYRETGQVIENPIKVLSVVDSGQVITANLKGPPSNKAVGSVAAWFIPCFVFWVVGVYVFIKKPKNTAAVLLCLSSLVFGLALSANQASERDVILAVHIAIIAAAIGPWLLLHFFLVLPEERTWLRNKPQLYSIYILPAIILILYPMIGYADGQPLPDFRIFRLLSYGFGFLGVIGVAIFNYVRARSSRTKQQMTIVLVGCLAALGPFLLLSLFPAVTEGVFFTPSEFSLGLISFIPLSLGYAVITQKLMDIDVVIRRGVVYGLITLVMAAVLTVAFALVLSSGLSPEFSQQFLLALLLSVLAVLLLGPIKNLIEAGLDKIFYKDRFDYRQTIQALSSSLSATSDTLVASSLIVDAPVTALNLSGACLFLATDSGSFEVGAARGIFSTGASQRQLLDLLLRRNTGIEFPNLAEHPDPDVAFIIPLAAAGKEAGVLFLSPKESRQEFTGSDFYLIQGLASVAAVSLRGLLIAEQDVKARRRHEQAILAAKQEWESTFDSIPDLICIVDKDHTIVRVNRAMAEKVGMSPAETVGKKCYELMHDTKSPPECCPGLRTSRGCALDNEINRCGSVYQINISPLKDGGKSSGRYVHIARDVTAIKNAEAEQQRLKEKAELSSRLAAVGEMAAGIAHEINNPLTGVLGFSDLLSSREDLPEDIKEDVKIIADGSKRVGEIVRRMLTFARQTKPIKACVSITELIDNTLELRAYVLATAGIEVVRDYQVDLPWLVVDPGQMQQVFLNLIVNAEYAIKKTGRPGKLTITTGLAGDHMRITFADNGPGIEKEIISKLFQPFFTTKETGEGTGLGLSLSRSIVLEHGGTLEVESRPGEGASFIVELPLDTVSEEPFLSPADAVTMPPSSAEADILVIDDEECIRDLAKGTLARGGRTVEAAGSAAEALELLQHKHYDVIIMDLRMPGSSGMALYGDIIERHPEMNGRIIIITGDALGEDVQTFVERQKLKILPKPFDPVELEQAVNRILSAAAAG